MYKLFPLLSLKTTIIINSEVETKAKNIITIKFFFCSEHFLLKSASGSSKHYLLKNTLYEKWSRRNKKENIHTFKVHITLWKIFIIWMLVENAG